MVDWVTLVASVGLSLLGSALLVDYRLRREQSFEESVELEQWYSDSAGYAAEVRRIWQRLFDSAEHSGMNLSEIQSEMSLLEGQLSRHASNGEQLGADERVIETLDGLASECRRASEGRLHTNSLSEFDEYRDDVLDAVQDVEESLEDR